MTVKSEYGRALFLLAKENGSVEKIKCDLAVAIAVLKENPEYIKMLDTPAISKKEKLALADEAFSSVDESVSNLIKILSERHIVATMPDVYKTYISLYNEDTGIEEVEVITAIALSEAQADAMKKKLAGITGKTIILKNTVDDKILGGVKLRYEGKQIDASLKTRLDGFAESLRNIII